MTDRMSPQDTWFLHLEDGVSHMHIASVAIFEGPVPPFADILSLIETKLPLVPRYRQIVKGVPFELGRSVWVDDPHFNLEYHLRHTALPAPGGEADLRKLVGRVMSQQLDRSKPLWEIWIVEGLEDDHWAMLAKTHHAMVDGVAGSDLLAVIMDVSPDPSPAATVEWRPRPIPSGLRLVTEATVGLLKSPYEQTRALRARGRALRQALAQVLEVARGLTTMGGLVRPMPVPASTARSAPTVATPGPRPPSTTSRRSGRDSGGPSTTSSWPPSPTGSASCSGRGANRWTGWCGPWCRCRSGRGTRADGRWATGRWRTGSRPCSPSSRWGSPTPQSASGRSSARWPA